MSGRRHDRDYSTDAQPRDQQRYERWIPQPEQQPSERPRNKPSPSPAQHQNPTDPASSHGRKHQTSSRGYTSEGYASSSRPAPPRATPSSTRNVTYETYNYAPQQARKTGNSNSNPTTQAHPPPPRHADAQPRRQQRPENQPHEPHANGAKNNRSYGASADSSNQPQGHAAAESSRQGTSHRLRHTGQPVASTEPPPRAPVARETDPQSYYVDQARERERRYREEPKERGGNAPGDEERERERRKRREEKLRAREIVERGMGQGERQGKSREERERPVERRVHSKQEPRARVMQEDRSMEYKEGGDSSDSTRQRMKTTVPRSRQHSEEGHGNANGMNMNIASVPSNSQPPAQAQANNPPQSQSRPPPAHGQPSLFTTSLSAAQYNSAKGLMTGYAPADVRDKPVPERNPSDTEQKQAAYYRSRGEREVARAASREAGTSGSDTERERSGRREREMRANGQPSSGSRTRLEDPSAPQAPAGYRTNDLNSRPGQSRMETQYAAAVPGNGGSKQENPKSQSSRVHWPGIFRHREPKTQPPPENANAPSSARLPVTGQSNPQPRSRNADADAHERKEPPLSFYPTTAPAYAPVPTKTPSAPRDREVPKASQTHARPEPRQAYEGREPPPPSYAANATAYAPNTPAHAHMVASVPMKTPSAARDREETKAFQAHARPEPRQAYEGRELPPSSYAANAPVAMKTPSASREREDPKSSQTHAKPESRATGGQVYEGREPPTSWHPTTGASAYATMAAPVPMKNPSASRDREDSRTSQTHARTEPRQTYEVREPPSTSASAYAPIAASIPMKTPSAARDREDPKASQTHARSETQDIGGHAYEDRNAAVPRTPVPPPQPLTSTSSAAAAKASGLQSIPEVQIAVSSSFKAPGATYVPTSVAQPTSYKAPTPSAPLPTMSVPPTSSMQDHASVPRPVIPSDVSQPVPSRTGFQIPPRQYSDSNGDAYTRDYGMADQESMRRRVDAADRAQQDHLPTIVPQDIPSASTTSHVVSKTTTASQRARDASAFDQHGIKHTSDEAASQEHHGNDPQMQFDHRLNMTTVPTSRVAMSSVPTAHPSPVLTRSQGVPHSQPVAVEAQRSAERNSTVNIHPSAADVREDPRVAWLAHAQSNAQSSPRLPATLDATPSGHMVNDITSRPPLVARQPFANAESRSFSTSHNVNAPSVTAARSPARRANILPSSAEVEDRTMGERRHLDLPSDRDERATVPALRPLPSNPSPGNAATGSVPRVDGAYGKIHSERWVPEPSQVQHGTPQAALASVAPPQVKSTPAALQVSLPPVSISRAPSGQGEVYSVGPAENSTSRLVASTQTLPEPSPNALFKSSESPAKKMTLMPHLSQAVSPNSPQVPGTVMDRTVSNSLPRKGELNIAPNDTPPSIQIHQQGTPRPPLQDMTSSARADDETWRSTSQQPQRPAVDYPGSARVRLRDLLSDEPTSHDRTAINLQEQVPNRPVQVSPPVDTFLHEIHNQPVSTPLKSLRRLDSQRYPVRTASRLDMSSAPAANLSAYPSNDLYHKQSSAYPNAQSSLDQVHANTTISAMKSTATYASNPGVAGSYTGRQSMPTQPSSRPVGPSQAPDIPTEDVARPTAQANLNVNSNSLDSHPRPPPSAPPSQPQPFIDRHVTQHPTQAPRTDSYAHHHPGAGQPQPSLLPPPVSISRSHASAELPPTQPPSAQRATTQQGSAGHNVDPNLNVDRSSPAQLPAPVSQPSGLQQASGTNTSSAAPNASSSAERTPGWPPSQRQSEPKATKRADPAGAAATRGRPLAPLAPSRSHDNESLRTPSSLGHTTTRPDRYNGSAPPVASRTASQESRKKSGFLNNLFRSKTPTPKRQESQSQAEKPAAHPEHEHEHEIWTPSPASAPATKKSGSRPSSAQSQSQSTDPLTRSAAAKLTKSSSSSREKAMVAPAPSKLQGPVNVPLPVPPSGGGRKSPAAGKHGGLFSRFLTPKRHRTMSSASVEAQDGTAVTYLNSPTASTATMTGSPPPAIPLRDPFEATQQWRNQAEADQHQRAKRHRPGVVFDFGGDDPPLEGRKPLKKRSSSSRLRGR